MISNKYLNTYLYVSPKRNKKGFYGVWIYDASCKRRQHIGFCKCNCAFVGGGRTFNEAVKVAIEMLELWIEIAKGKNRDIREYVGKGIFFTRQCK